jgi:hypothetical protein
MTEPKTKPTKQSIAAFLKTVDPKKREDAETLVALFTKVTGEKPVMWGTSIVGYGKLHYKSVSSEGDWMRTGFSPRKANFSLYVLEWQGKPSPLLKKLGKYKPGGGCLYINKLADIDLNVLELLIKESYNRKHRNETVK